MPNIYLHALRIALVAVLASPVGQTGLVKAQSYPVKPIRIISPFAPGGPTDILGRLLAPTLTERLGQPVIVENRVGAGGTMGTEFVAKSSGDGYTLLLGSTGPLAVDVSLYGNLPYDPLRDLEPVIKLASVPLVLVVHPAFPAKTLEELIAALKAAPGTYSIASAGEGTPQHLLGELLKSMTGVSMTAVPYKGSAPALVAVVAGQVPMMFDSTVSVLPHITTGRLRAVATTGHNRAHQLPDVPTMQESGMPGFEFEAWYGVLAPTGTPAPIIGKLNATIAAALDSPQLGERMQGLGSDAVHGSAADFRAFLRTEIEKWGQVVKKSGAAVH